MAASECETIVPKRLICIVYVKSMIALRSSHNCLSKYAGHTNSKLFLNSCKLRI